MSCEHFPQNISQNALVLMSEHRLRKCIVNCFHVNPALKKSVILNYEHIIFHILFLIDHISATYIYLSHHNKTIWIFVILKYLNITYFGPSSCTTESSPDNKNNPDPFSSPTVRKQVTD